MEMQSPAADLNRLIRQGYLSESALSTVTGIQPMALSVFLRDEIPGMGDFASTPTTSDEDARLSILAAQLADGLLVDDNDRIQGILESLTVVCGLSVQNVALLTRLDEDLIDIALQDPGLLSMEAKCALSIRASYIMNALSRAQAR